jgi:putative SOS response-associated peptidase YedK
MCGRFTLRTRLNLILQQFAIEQAEVDFEPRYNISPTTSVPIVRQVGTMRELVKVKWGLIPSWSKEPKMSYSTINAKSEEADKKPAFRSAIKSRRCLVVADGYYEWETIKKKKFPHYFQLRDQPVFGFAGLWERWDKSEPAVESCTILTTRANELQGKYHDRMPVILSPNDFSAWLDPENKDPASLHYLYEPYPPDEMTDTAVNPYVNKAGNEGLECIEAFKAE